MILELTTLKSLFPKYKLDRKGENLLVPCPKCGQMEFGLAIYQNNHPANCYRKKKCGWVGNIFSLLKEIGRTDLLKGEGDGSEIANEKLENKFELELEQKKEKVDYSLTIPTQSLPIGWRRITYHPYLESRQFYEYSRYEVGVSKLDPRLRNNYLIFLVRQFGEVKGYLGRHLWDKNKIEVNNKKFKETGEGKFIKRYSNSPSTDFGSLLFGYDEINSSTTIIILVEGIFDKFRVDHLLKLHDQQEIKCVASFKCHLSDVQKELLKSKKIETLILLYDSDVIKDIIITVNDIKYDFPNIQIGLHPNPEIDPGDYSEEDIDLVLNNLVTPTQLSSTSLITYKLE